MGEGTRVVKRLPSGCRERLRQKPDTRGLQMVPSKAFGLQRLLVTLECEPFKEILAQPSLESGQLMDSGGYLSSW